MSRNALILSHFTEMYVDRYRVLFAVFFSTVVVGTLQATFYILFTIYTGSTITNVLWINSTFHGNPSSKVGIWHPPPSGTPFPPPESFLLTKEMLKNVAKDKNVIVLTFGNYAFIDFIMNWIQHLCDLGVYNIIIGGLDRRVIEELYWKGIPVFSMASNLMSDDIIWGSPEFSKIGEQKVLLLNKILPFGYDILMCDTDTVWLKNPLPYFARFPEADVLTSSDDLSTSVTDDRLEVWNEERHAYNIGIFYWRSTEPAIQLAKEWLDLLARKQNIWDQTGFVQLLNKKFGPSVEGGDGLVYAFDGSLKLGILPVSLFCSGHTYFIQGMAEQLKLEPYAVHTTYQYSGTEGKRHRLREAMLFFDPPEYYDAPGGFLSFKLSVPKKLLFGGAHSIENHFSLVNYQLKQVRTALAVALMLNRTLVMPPMWCRLDKFWFEHPGIIPQTLTKQPFICPMDHIFEISEMADEFLGEEFGPRINFREYSFLKNPSLPKKVKESILDVRICEGNFATCNKNKTDQIGMPKNASDLMIVELLSSYKDTKVIEFSSMDLDFHSFSDKAKEEKFRNRVQRYTSAWCCLPSSLYDKGRISYDVYWDEKPPTYMEPKSM